MSEAKENPINEKVFLFAFNNEVFLLKQIAVYPVNMD